jgi:hypothetical protein
MQAARVITFHSSWAAADGAGEVRGRLVRVAPGEAVQGPRDGLMGAGFAERVAGIATFKAAMNSLFG